MVGSMCMGMCPCVCGPVMGDVCVPESTASHLEKVTGSGSRD